MEKDFWLQRWESGSIGFHRNDPNPLLLEHFSRLELRQASRVFIPLCGKTVDIAWLLAGGFRVVGIEFSKKAVDELFQELKLEPVLSQSGDLIHYSATDIDIFSGDIFHLDGEMLGPVDAVYDRAALVALPEEMRERYATHLKRITTTAPQLLITYHYDQSLEPGPPFSIDSEEIDRHYKENFRIIHCKSVDVPGGLRGKCPATEHVWHLQPYRMTIGEK